MTNRNLHMRFRLAPRSMTLTLDDLELPFKYSRNFALLRIFGWTDICCWRCDCEECKGWFSEWVVSYMPRLSRAYLCVS